MERYNKTLKQKKDLERTLRMYMKEFRYQMAVMNMERSSVEGGLLVSVSVMLYYLDYKTSV